MAQKPKLELAWIGKENRPKLVPRILLEDIEKSYHPLRRVTERNLFNNRLIWGDDFLAPKALNRPAMEIPELFDAQDGIDRQHEQLIAEIEGKLQQRGSTNPLFSIGCRLM